VTIKRAFGEVIKELRAQKKLTQEDVAHESFLDRSFISLLETGRQQPSLVTIFQLSRALEVTASHIIALVETKLQNSAVQ
jgi:transcriptional regulator with XRE-family HTH domain